jgi:hypothetical protein
MVQSIERKELFEIYQINVYTLSFRQITPAITAAALHCKGMGF